MCREHIRNKCRPLTYFMVCIWYFWVNVLCTLEEHMYSIVAWCICSLNINWFNLVDSAVQIFCILDFIVQLSYQLLRERERLKSPIIADLSISPFSSVKFCLIYFKSLYQEHMHVEFWCTFLEIILYHYEVILSLANPYLTIWLIQS